ncbi:hypothetical protein [Microbacterium sp. W4I20]|uniref:hypothetical protein n=1 Tax=Microbacterium sp. W4I20 TaxID=3042262 RepID=UPI00278890D1|nr:hypothetical protein [Microbacterium sp. W4I20]MDQ0726057.1 hypothetical protein [Microbacterium sp. W4I20]
MNGRQRDVLGIILVASVVLSGCAAAPAPQPPPTTATPDPSDAPLVPGAPATWQLIDPDSVTSDSTTLEVEVTRLDCANGVTGELLAPVVTYDADRVTIRIDAEPTGSGAANCLGNDAVPVTVTLREPVGERTLVDGACISTDAERTAACESSERGSAQS